MGKSLKNSKTSKIRPGTDGFANLCTICNLHNCFLFKYYAAGYVIHFVMKMCNRKKVFNFFFYKKT